MKLGTTKKGFEVLFQHTFCARVSPYMDQPDQSDNGKNIKIVNTCIFLFFISPVVSNLWTPLCICACAVIHVSSTL